jgi:hypothetical protein
MGMMSFGGMRTLSRETGGHSSKSGIKVGCGVAQNSLTPQVQRR